MTKLIYRLERSFESAENGPISDLMAGVAFVLALAAGLSWLLVF